MEIIVLVLWLLIALMILIVLINSGKNMVDINLSFFREKSEWRNPVYCSWSKNNPSTPLFFYFLIFMII